MNYLVFSEERTLSTKPNVREKFELGGISSLSNLELVMLLLGSGTKKLPVPVLSKHVLDVIMSFDYENVPKKLSNLSGMGSGKIALISAMLELGRRMNGVRGTIITKPEEVLPLIGHYALERKEHFLSVTLNGAHEVIKIRLVSVGTLTRSIVHPREIFADAVSDRAAAIIVCHNHPSGKTDPSDDDIKATERLSEAARILGIQLLDHIVFSTAGFFSFQANGYL